jgi:putative cell wall-binding protein
MRARDGRPKQPHRSESAVSKLRLFVSIVASVGLVAAISLAGDSPAAISDPVSNFTIYGHVALGTASNNAGPSDVTVGVYQIDSNPNLDQPTASTKPDSEGNFQVTLDASGPITYGVRFTYTGTAGYLSTWWTPDAGTTNAYASYAGETTPIFLPSAAPIETNITLPLSASVSGTLATSSGGVPDTPTNIEVSARRAVINNGLFPYYQDDVQTTFLSSAGTYSFSGLWPGTYDIYFKRYADDPGAVQYATATVGSTIADPDGDNAEVLSGGENSTDMNAVAFVAAGVNGSVICATCSALALQGTVQIFQKSSVGAGWNYYALNSALSWSAPSDGAYGYLGLVPGTYRVVVSSGNYAQLGWGLVSSFSVSEGQIFHQDAQIVTPPISRLQGSDRFGTSVAISDDDLSGTSTYGPGVPVVYIASGQNYPDALSAGPAAAAKHGPLLLVYPTSIPSEVGSELARLKPQKIVVVGGPASVSDAVLSELNQYSPGNVTRESGDDRYATSIRVAEDAFPTSSTVYLATGTNFPDALSAGGAAAKKGAPVVIVNGDETAVDAATRNALHDLQAKNVEVIGGSASISDDFFTSLQSIPGLNVTRVSGADRFATSQAVTDDAFPSSITSAETGDPFTPPTYAFLALGTNFPDALSGSALAGDLGAPLYVIPSNCIPQSILQDIQNLQVTQVVLLGGDASLSSGVANFTSCPDGGD